MKNNSVQTSVVLALSAQLLSDFYHREFWRAKTGRFVSAVSSTLFLCFEYPFGTKA
jgi:hypothetical protein